MAKAFLCHSSIQKPIVLSVIKYLNEGSYEYDALTFEAGNDVNLEIERTLTSSDLIVLFISDESLESEWVQKEMRLAENKYYQIGRHTTLAFLIDYKLQFSDTRIPEWLRKNLILRHVQNPKIIAAKIKHSLRESLYLNNGLFKGLHSEPIGRNEEQGEFESYHYLNIKSKNLNFLLSGFEGVGRRSFLLKALKSVKAIPPSISEFIYFSLTSKSSIEDLLIQLESIKVDFNPDEFIDILTSSLESKIEYAISKINEYLEYNEVVCIVDDGCVIKPNHSIAPWFKSLISSSKIGKKYGLNVISKYRPHNLNYWPESLIHIHLEELKKADQIKLFHSLISNTKVELDGEQTDYIYSKLKGFPDQIKFIVQLLMQHKFQVVKNNPKLIEDYSDKKITLIAKTFLDDPETKDILVLLSQLDCISEKLLYDLIPDSKILNNALIKLHAGGAIERTGVSGELIKISELLGDFVKRTKIQLNPNYKQKLRKNIRESLTTEGNIRASDSSELLINIKALIKSGSNINAKYYIPSFVLQAVIDLYNSKKHKSVVKYSEIILERNNQDSDIQSQIRYYLCQALAHLHKESKIYEVKFFEQLEYFKGPDFHFLKGFFFRIAKRDSLAQKEFEEAIKNRPSFPKAKRELVTVLLGQDKPLEALKWAKSNYLEENGNPYMIHAYFQCLIRDTPPQQHKHTLQKLLNEIQSIQTNKSQTFYTSMAGQYSWIIDNNSGEAINILQDAITGGDKVYAPKALHRLASTYGMTALKNTVSKYFEEIEEED